MEDHLSKIQKAYEQTQRGDSAGLFSTVMEVAGDIGMAPALALLEGCVTAKRLAWLDENLAGFERTGRPVLDGYRLFYETYLHVSVPEEGEIIEHTDQRIVMRWWNPCSTLNACQQLGLDTRQVCLLAYHRPVEEFLKRLDSRLRFERNYAALRPYTPYCEEIIYLSSADFEIG